MKPQNTKIIIDTAKLSKKNSIKKLKKSWIK